MDAGSGLDGSAIPTTAGDPAGAGSGDADNGAGASARARNHVPQSAGGVPEAPGSEPAENGVPRFRGARVENTAGGDQRLLRFNAGRLARGIIIQTKRNTGRIKGKL